MKEYLFAVAGAVLIFFLGVIGYFRIPVSAYYKASEKAFEIPGRADGFIAQGISVRRTRKYIFRDGLYERQERFAPLPGEKRKRNVEEKFV